MNNVLKNTIDHIRQKKGIEFVREIHQGPYSYLYLGHRAEETNHQGKDFVVKLIKPHKENHAIVAPEKESIIASYIHHKNIVRYDCSEQLDAKEFSVTRFIITDFIDGYILPDLLRRLNYVGKKIKIGQAITLVKGVLEALDYIHNLKTPTKEALDIIHKDISPANVMISKAGEIKLLDFGVSSVGLDNPNIRAGTGPYMSPEVSRFEGGDRRSDLYSVAILLASILSMQKYKKNTLKALKKSKTIDSRLYEILKKGAATDPNKRFQTASEMINALDHYLYTNKILVYHDEIKKLMTLAVSCDEKSTISEVKQETQKQETIAQHPIPAKKYKFLINPLLIGSIFGLLFLMILFFIYQPYLKQEEKRISQPAKQEQIKETKPLAIQTPTPSPGTTPAPVIKKQAQEIIQKPDEQIKKELKKASISQEKPVEKEEPKPKIISYGELFIGASPLARISINNHFSNRYVPFTTKLPTGTHKVKIQWENTKAFYKNIKISPNKKTKCQAMFSLGLKSMDCR
jgi:serine/threonine protein kinase